MYKFHYDYIKNKYGNNSTPLSTDIIIILDNSVASFNDRRF